uniref:limulus clotting factor C n=1 Tax=Hirondellea gigas TaxID=1518452 RepID=A0A2P2HWI7_9CRUS
MSSWFWFLLLLAAVSTNGLGLHRPDRIVGGDPVRDGDALWQVSLQSMSGGYHFCGGTLISSNWVVTAGHCTLDFTEKQMRVVVGTNDLLKDNNAYYMVERIIRNPGFNQMTLENDIALIKLLQPASRAGHTGSSIAMEANENLPEEDCRVTGFGRLSSAGAASTKLMSAVVPLRTYEDCVKAFPPDMYTVGKGHLCAGGDHTDACQGDSGGPLVCCKGKTLSASGCKLVGVVSWGIGCATPKLPGVYTKVSHYRHWVNQEIKNYNEKRRSKRLEED